MNQKAEKGRPNPQLKLTQTNSNQLKQNKLKSQSVCANIDFDPERRDNLGFLLRIRLGMLQYLNVLLSSSWEITLRGCASQYNLTARTYQNAEFTTI